MRHEQLWAPWRLGYILSSSQGADTSQQSAASATQQQDQPLAWLPGADPACFLCRGVAEHADRENLIVSRHPQTVVMLNRYPYNNGHLLIAPLAHKGRLAELSDAEQLESQQVLAGMVALLERLIKAEGFNIGLNLGRVAGAGLPGHLHWHIVPRWHGDTNFMSSLAGIRVIPQSLDALWEILVEALHEKAEG